MSRRVSKNVTNKKNKIFELIGHICVGLSIFIKGIDKIDHHHSFVGSILILAGLLVIVFSIKHKKIERYIGHIKYFILGIEGVVMALIGYSYYQDGSHLVHYAYYLTSVLFFIAIPVSYFLHESKKRKELFKIDVGSKENNGALNSIASKQEKN
jgi:hypothetical protein